jgi:hypothetical protein
VQMRDSQSLWRRAYAVWRFAGPRPLRIGVGPRLAIVHCPESSSLGQLRVENEPIRRDPSPSVMPYNSHQGLPRTVVGDCQHLGIERLHVHADFEYMGPAS